MLLHKIEVQIFLMISPTIQQVILEDFTVDHVTTHNFGVIFRKMPHRLIAGQDNYRKFPGCFPKLLHLEHKLTR